MFSGRLNNLLCSIKQGYEKKYNCIQYKMCKKIFPLLDFLQQNGYITHYIIKKEEKQVIIFLQYDKQGCASLKSIKIFFKPTFFLTITYKDILSLRQKNYNVGTYLISTNLGFISDKEAIKKKIGGILFCYLF